MEKLIIASQNSHLDFYYYNETDSNQFIVYD